MVRAITTVVVCAAVLLLSSCAREDPRASRDQLLSSESSRSVDQTVALRNRLNGQAQR